MATFALKPLFKINLRNRGNALAGAQLRAWRANTHQRYTFSLGVRNTSSCISPPSTWVVVLLPCLSDSLLPLGEDAEEADLLQSLSAPSVLSTRVSQLWGASGERCHKNTESPSSFLSLFFYWKLHQRKQKFKPNIHWSTESPRSGKWQLFRIVLQMENIKKKNHSSTDLSETFWDISTQMPI